MGVYLAASQGYKQAVQFENMTSYKENYYLQKSLQYELQDNVNILKDYVEKIQSSGLSTRMKPLNFYNLVWENMKFSKTTLGTPPELLRDAQRFYRDVANTHKEVASGGFSISYGTKLLQESIDLAEKELLPALEKSTSEIKKQLDGTDVVL